MNNVQEQLPTLRNQRRLPAGVVLHRYLSEQVGVGAAVVHDVLPGHEAHLGRSEHGHQVTARFELLAVLDGEQPLAGPINRQPPLNFGLRFSMNALAPSL
jgi:hypothetical protein